MSTHDRVATERDQAALVRELLIGRREDVANARVRAANKRADVAEHELAGLREAMETRAVIEQAKGMVMLTLKIDADAAFNVLVQRSQSTHTKLHDVACDIVAAGVRPLSP